MSVGTNGRRPLMDPSAIYDIIKSTITLLVVIDPVGIIPVVVKLTKDMEKNERDRTFRLAFYVSVGLLIAFAILGQQILLFFGISLHSFMIAGGILLLLLSLQIIFSEEGTFGSTKREELGAIPLAFPLLVGPGAITTTIVAIQSSGLLLALGSIAIAMVFTYIVLKAANRIYSLLGKTGSDVVAKIVAVLIASIAIQYILTGIQSYYPPA
jgi:multiple antibiotic resistance protein